MKKWLSAILMLVLLLQALPLSALASAGHVLTDEELAAAYALTGFGDSGARSNTAVHKGMKPNETWNAMQVSDWLDEQLNTYVFSVEDILSRASVKLARLKASDQMGYSHFSDDNTDYRGMINYVQTMYENAEALREEMRWQQDRLQEKAGIIAELGGKLQNEGDSLYPSDRVRLSAAIKEAEAELKAARQEVADRAAEWEGSIKLMQTVLDPAYEGAAEPVFQGGNVGEWLAELSAYGEEAAENRAPVALVNASGSRLGRMSAGGSVLSNADSASVYVMTEDEISLKFYTADESGNRKYLKGLKVTLQDLRNPNAAPETFTTRADGAIHLTSNLFTVDDDKNVLFKLDVEAEAQGCRSLGSAKVKMKLGEERKMPMQPLSDTVANAAQANAGSDSPYVYSASFEGNDIFKDSYEMMNSHLNTWDFEIKVEVRYPEGGEQPEPLLSYWTIGDSWTHYEQRWAKPTSREGNVYTFKNQWKKLIAPDVDEELYPFIAFSKDGSAEHFNTELISVKSVVDSPFEAGSDAFVGVYEKGLGLSFQIPLTGDHTLDIAFNLPWKKYLPKVTIDNAGFVTAFIGTDLFSDKLEEKASWQSRDMQDFADGQKRAEREGGFAQHLAQMGAAYDYYKTGGWKFLGESKLEFGWFVLGSGLMDADNIDTKDETGIIKLRVGTGVLLKYSYSWTLVHMVGPVPAYISFSLGVNAGVGVSFQVGWSWKVGEGFKAFEFKPFNDITILISFSFTAQAGAGIKGVADLYVRFLAQLNFRITLYLTGVGLNSFTVGGEISLTVGATIIFVEISKTWGPWGGTWYDSAASNALPPLQRYVTANAVEQITAATQEPTSYPGLAPAAKAILTNEKNARSNIKVATSNGHTFAFYLDKVGGQQRVCWVDVNTGRKGNAQMLLDDRTAHWSRDLNDYAFDAWSDGDTIVLVGCCAGKFDADGYPVESPMTNSQAYSWIMPLTYWSERDDLVALGDNFYSIEKSAVSLDLAHNPRGITNPKIEWARVTYETYDVSKEKYVSGIELYGFAERVDGGDASKAGYACFEYAGGRNFNLMSDMAVMNALGDDHERVNLRSSVKGYSGRIEGSSRFRCFGFVALSRPRDNAEGERAIELYDWEMNTAPVKFKVQTKPAFQATLTETKRRAIAVKKGDIGAFEMVQTVGTGSDNYAQTLFYTEAETNGDGVKRYKLKGLNIGGKKGALTRSLSYDVTDVDYDITVPSAAFEVQTVNGTPYIYWLSTVEKKKESDPDAWRLWVCLYDPATDTVSAPEVFSEFTLDRGIVPRDVELTENGQGFLTATPLPKDGDKDPKPMTLYSFPLTLKPVLTLKDMAVEDTTVAAGDFEDTTIVLMNEGNMGLSAFDVEMFIKEGGRETVVETLHYDCMRPERSTLTMVSGKAQKELLKGREAVYRNSDYDYASRPRGWTLEQEKLTLKASQGDKNAAWTSSLNKRDSKNNYIQTNMLMPGALASFTGTLKIPENWSGDKTLYLRVKKMYAYANWQGAMANAAGAKGDSGIQPNAAATQELTWTLNGEGDRLELEPGTLASNAAFMNAVGSGLIANAVDAGDAVPLEVSVHDVEIDHRLYRDVDGTRLLDIIVSNFADTDDSFKLTCQVYLDGSDEAYVVTLPYYDKAVANRMTHTITLPVASLVPDADRHSSARVVISAVSRDEVAYANNAFTLILGGGDPLHFEKQPEDVTAQEGEDVSFTVEVGGGKTPYTYQWQVWDPKHEKWVDLPGFTEPTLSRKDIEKKWDGARFRCVVTDAEGTQIISQEVTLTVRDSVDTGDDSNLPLYTAVALAALALLWWMRRRIS